MSTDQQSPPRYFTRIVLIVLGFMAIPLTLALVVFPLLSAPSVTHLSQVDPADVSWMNVRLLNRSELDGGDDVWPFAAATEDYAAILEPLRGVPEVADFRDARGPWLGEIRLKTRSGQDATVRLYWVRTPEDERGMPAFHALLGGPAFRHAAASKHVPVARLRFQIGDHKFEGYGAANLIRTATAAEKRGKPSPR